MKELIGTIIDGLEEMKGSSADKITHGLKIYNGKEYESIIAGVTARISDMQKIMNISEKKIMSLEKALIVEGIVAVTGISTTLLGICFLKREQKELKEIIEKYKELECKEVNYIECSECGKEAHNVDEINVLFGYKKLKDKLSPETMCKECRNKIQ